MPTHFTYILLLKGYSLGTRDLDAQLASEAVKSTICFWLACLVSQPTARQLTASVLRRVRIKCRYHVNGTYLTMTKVIFHFFYLWAAQKPKKVELMIKNGVM